MPNIKRKIFNCKSALQILRTSMIKQTYANQRNKYKQLDNIQNVGIGEHIDGAHKIQEEMQIRLAEEEIK